MLLLPPAQVSPSQSPLTAAVLAFCSEVATQMTLEDLESKADPKRLGLLKKQARQLLQASQGSLPSNDTARPLLEGALGALELATGQEAQGERRYGQAAKALALRFRSARLALGPQNPELLPELEALALLYRMAGLRDAHWRDEALRIRVQIGQRPDPALEKDLAAAVEDHYGPWLTVAEEEPMLEFCGSLAQVWMRYPRDLELTRRVLEVGLKSNATRVWRLAARRADEGLRRGLSALVQRMDPSAAGEEKSRESLLELGESLLGTPLETSGRDLLKRLAKVPSLSGPARRRVARALEDQEGEATLLEAELRAAKPREALPLLEAASELLREHPHSALLEEGTRQLQAAALLDPPAEELPRWLEAWMGFQDAGGHPEASQELLRLRLALADPKGRNLPDRCALLAKLGRWEDLELSLAPLVGEDRDGLRSFWRFRAALGEGRPEDAKRWLLAWLDQVMVAGPDAPSIQLPGISAGIPLLEDQQERLTQLAAHWGPLVLPGQESLLAMEPWRILAALDPEAPASLLPGKVEESLRWRLNRLSGSHDTRALRALLKDAETLLGPSRILVAEVLLSLGRAEKETDEGAPLLERAMGILEQAPEDQTMLLVETSSSLAEVQCIAGNGQALEREMLRLMGLLECAPELKGDLANNVLELPTLLLLQLWRQQRLQELLAVSQRARALASRAPKKEEAFNLFQNQAHPKSNPAALNHVACLQTQIQGAGLP